MRICIVGRLNAKQGRRGGWIFPRSEGAVSVGKGLLAETEIVHGFEDWRFSDGGNR